MFKSTAEFEKAMYDILLKFRDGNIDPNTFGLEIEEADFNDALARIADTRLVSGIGVQRTLGGVFIDLMNPRITYDGLAFIERYEQKQK